MDDWNGSANANIFWKPTTEYVYAPTLDTEKFDAAKKLTVFPNPITNTFMLNKFVERVEIYNLIGKLIETFEGDFEKEVRFDISHLSPGLYLTHIKSNKETITRKLIKH